MATLAVPENRSDCVIEPVVTSPLALGQAEDRDELIVRKDKLPADIDKARVQLKIIRYFGVESSAEVLGVESKHPSHLTTSQCVLDVAYSDRLPQVLVFLDALQLLFEPTPDLFDPFLFSWRA